MDELQFEPSVDADEIVVSVREGVVTLSGEVNLQAKKIGAEKAANRVGGMKALVENIRVNTPSQNHRTDTELAGEIIKALEWNIAVREEMIKIKVENGLVTINGEVEHDNQRRIILDTIENIQGVVTVINKIRLKHIATADNIAERIRSAFERSALLDASKIKVSVSGSTVLLTGQVRSLAEREDAERAARVAPGIEEVNSRITVEIPYNEYEDD